MLGDPVVSGSAGGDACCETPISQTNPDTGLRQRCAYQANTRCAIANSPPKYLAGP